MLCSKKSAKLLSTLTVLAGLLVSVALTGCQDPNKGKDTETEKQYQTKLVFPAGDKGTGTNYYVNGTAVSDEYWKSFVVANNEMLTSAKYKSSYGDMISFTNTNGKLTTAYTSFNGEVIGVDNTVSDGYDGFIFLVKTVDHTNWILSNGEYVEGSPHSCYLPIYFSFIKASVKSGSYYNAGVSDFTELTDALTNSKYDSTIYAYAGTYNRQ